MESEEFISGFCRTCNRINSVCCEYEEENGKKVLAYMDCGHEKCLHTSACEIYKEAHRLSEE